MTKLIITNCAADTSMHAGVPARFADSWRLERRFRPNMSDATRTRKLKGWSQAVKGVLATDDGEE